MYSSRYYSGIITLFVIILLAVSTASAGSQVSWTKSELLYLGQGIMHQIQVDCGTNLVLNSPGGTTFDLYAMRNYNRFGSCQDVSYIRTHYDKVSIGSGGTSSLYLEPGTWCVVIFARMGSGQYLLEGISSCPISPTPYPEPGYRDSCFGGPCQPACNPFKTDVKTGYLSQGQSKTTGYFIPGQRSYIEWILTGPCGDEIIPMAMMSGSEVSSMRTRYCGTDFDLYIYQQGEPRQMRGYADYADVGSGFDAYVGISYPSTGATYYAQVYAKSGRGQYTLTCRTYTCQNEVAMMMKSPEISTMMYTATFVAPPFGREIQ